MATRHGYRIGELAERCGVSPRTIDYYTQMGLLRAISRSSGNYRLYDESSAERLRLVKLYQERGLHLRQILERLSLLEASHPDGRMQEHLDRLGRLLKEAEAEVVLLSQSFSQLAAGGGEAGVSAREVRLAAQGVLHRALALSQAVASLLDSAGSLEVDEAGRQGESGS